MTEKVNPSFNRRASPFKTAGAIAYGGHGEEGFIRKSGNPTDIAVQDPDINDTTLNAFAQSSTASSLTVTIDPGESFIFGAWTCIDTETTVTLPANENAATVFVGWNKNSSDDVIIGTDATFANAIGDTDKRIPLFDFETDGTGVTRVTDRRRLGREPNVSTDRGEVRRVLDSTEKYTIEEDESLIVLDFFDEGSGDFTVKGDFLIIDN